MKPLIAVLFCVAVFGAGTLGYCISKFSGESSQVKNDLEFARARLLGMHASLFSRFEYAYSNQAATVAIWEGSNLLTYITGKVPGVPALNLDREITSILGKTPGVPIVNSEQDVMLSHAKLSSLYQELGLNKEADFHLMASARIMQEGRPNSDIIKCLEGVKRFAQTNYLLNRKLLAK